MPVEFALRPRIRLREDPAPARRARPRLPKFALPALAYWVAIAGLVYAFVRQHDASMAPAETEAALAPVIAPEPAPAVRQWWRPLPAREERAPAQVAEPSAASEPEPLEASLSGHAEPPRVEAAPAESALAALAPAPPSPAEVARAFNPPAARSLPASRRALRAAPTRAAVTPDEPAATDVHVGVPGLALAPSLSPAPDLTSAPARPPTPARPPAPAPALVAGHGLPSCEAALAAASQDVDFSGSNRVADLPTQAIAAVLENGAWLSSCAIPDQTTLDVCVAIQGGRVVGASVASRPTNSALNSCVKLRASSLQFPYSPHLDLARTRF